MSYRCSSHLHPAFRSSSGKSLAAAVFAVALLMTMAAGAQAIERAQTVGSVKTVSGTAYLSRNGEQLPAKVGDYLLEGDTLMTDNNSSMGVIFRDDTLLSLGSRSQVRIDAFVFDPAQDNMSFLTNVTKGTAQYISGQIAKLSPEKMSVETPLSTIGIRGTRFLVKVD
jgi:hypothetical protein